MATYATAQDVEVELGRPPASPAEEAQWEAWLDRVERAIQRVFRQAGYDLAAQVALGDPTADEVRDVMVAAVVRKVANPSGWTSTTRSIDDGSVTHRRDYAGDADPLALTDDDIASLLPHVATSAFSTRPTFDPHGASGPHWWGYEVGNTQGPWIG